QRRAQRDDHPQSGSGSAAHFSVSIRPLMNQRCISTTMAIGGTMARTTVAITRFHSAAASPVGTIRLMLMTTVDIDSSVVTRRGHRYWFQPKMNRITKSAAMFVLDKGARIDQKNRSAPAPSIRAASASSSGTVRKNCRKRNVAVADAMSGMVRPAYEFRSFRSATTLKVGMMRISTGSISVRKIVQKHAIRNGKRKYTMA